MEFKEVAIETIRYVNSYKSALTKAFLITFFLNTLLIALDSYLTNTFVGFVTGAFRLLIQTIFAITIHRVILLSHNPDATKVFFEWSKRETSFALYIIGMALLSFPIYLISSLLGFLGIVIAVVLTSLIISRCSLVFPSVAIDKSISLEASWEFTKNYKLLMFLVVLVFPMLLNIPLTFIANKFSYAIVPISFMSTLSTVFTVAALSVSYKFITKENFVNP